jgi:hypothetical protein
MNNNIRHTLYNILPICHHDKIFDIIMYTPINVYNNYTNYSVYDDKNTHMKGCAKKIFTYNNKDFRFRFYKSDKSLTIYTENKQDRCILILLNQEKHFAFIHSLGYFPSCSKPKTLCGKEILMVSIKYLKKNKEKYGINRIVLTDNAIKRIPECKEPIKLSINYFLLNGDTWYGSFGFRPYDITLDKPNKDMIKDYDKTKDKIRKTKAKKYKKFFDKYDFIKMKESEYDLNISYFLKKITSMYDDKYKCEINRLIEKLYRKMKFPNFHTTSFYYDL